MIIVRQHSHREAALGSVAVDVRGLVEDVVLPGGKIMPWQKARHDMLDLDVVGEHWLRPGELLDALAWLQDLGERARTRLDRGRLHVLNVDDHLARGGNGGHRAPRPEGDNMTASGHLSLQLLCPAWLCVYISAINDIQTYVYERS